MSRVRVLVGTRKGAFVLTSDGKRERWEVGGPHFAGWEIYHVKGSPVDPDRLYASQCSGWFGQMIQRSDDGGKTWEPVGNEFKYDGVPGTHQWYDGTQHPWEFKRVWHFEPSLTDPDTVYAGVEDAAIFRTTDGGKTWHELPGLRGHESGPAMVARRGRDGPALDPARSDAIRAGSTSRSRPRACSGPTTAARPGSRSTAGLRSQYIPDPAAEVGHCVHRIAMHPSRPDVLFMQKHWDVMRQRRCRRVVARGQRQPADRFRLPDRRPRARAGDRSTSCRSRATRSISRSTASSGSTAAGPAGTSGSRSPRGLPQERLLRQRAPRGDGGRSRSTSAASTSARRAGRCTPRPTRATPGPRSSATCRPSSPWRSRPCHDPGRPPLSSPEPGAGRRRGGAPPSRARRPCARSSMRWRPLIRRCAGRSATTARSAVGRSCGSSPASRTCPTSRRMPRCPVAVASGLEPFLVVGAIAGG